MRARVAVRCLLVITVVLSATVFALSDAAAATTGPEIQSGTMVSPTPRTGASWTGQFSGTTACLHSVHFVDATHGWAVGDDTTILATTDGGVHWTEQYVDWTSHYFWNAVSLFAVQFVDAQHGWAVGEHGTILSTADGGVHWGVQSQNDTFSDHPAASLSSVHFTDPAHGWVVGNLGMFRATVSGGAYWTPTSLNMSRSYTDVHFVDNAHGWILGSQWAPDGVFSIILVTTDGGAHWTARTPGTTRYLDSVDFTDIGSGWVVGQNGAVLHTLDGGQTWMNQTSGTNVWLHDVNFIDSNTGWVVGDGGTVLHTTNGGATWANGGLVWIQLLGTSNNLHCVHFVDSTHGWVVGDGGIILRYGPASDHIPPSTSASGVPTGWVSSGVTITLTTDTAGSSVANTWYSLNGGIANLYTHPISISAEGTTSVEYWSVNASGNVEPTQTAFARIDRTAPFTTDDALTTCTLPAIIHLTPTDAISGVMQTRWCVDGVTYGTGTTVVIGTPGAHTVEYSSVDFAGNGETTRTTTATVVPFTPLDIDAPAVVATPTIDGTVDIAEWFGAWVGTFPIPSVSGENTATLKYHVMHDSTYLYAAIQTPLEAGWDARAQLLIDGNHNHTPDGTGTIPYRDMILSSMSPGSWWGYNLVQSIESPNCATDIDRLTPTHPDGSHTAATIGGAGVDYEFAIPLASLGVSSGETVGLLFEAQADATNDHLYRFPYTNDNVLTSSSMATYADVRLIAAPATARVTPSIAKTPTGSLYTLTRSRGVAYFTFGATLRTTTGPTIASKRVLLQRSTNGTTWSTAATLCTNAYGRVSRRVAFTTRGTTYWRWYSPADTRYNAATSTRTRIVTR